MPPPDLSRLSRLVFAMAALPLMAACATDKTATAPASEGLFAEIVQPTRQTLPESKAAFEQAIESELALIGGEVDQVQQVLLQIAPEVDHETKQAVIEFNQSIEAFARQYQQFRKTADGDWQNNRRAVERLLTKTREALFVMRTQAESALRLENDSPYQAMRQG